MERVNTTQTASPSSASLLTNCKTYLGGDVGVLLPIAVAVVGVDVVRPDDPVHGLEDHPAVVVGNDVGVPAKQRHSIVLVVAVGPWMDGNARKR